MPFIHRIDPQREWLITQASGAITYDDIRNHLLAEQADQYLGYPELIDGTSATVAFSAEDTRRIVAWIRETASTVPLGPTAIVVSTDVAYGMMRMLEVLLGDVAMVRPFRSLADAELWLVREGGAYPSQ